MEQFIRLQYSGLYLVIKITGEGDVLLLHLSVIPFLPQTIYPQEEKRFRLLEIQASGYNQNDHHANKHTGCNPGYQLRYQKHTIKENTHGLCLEISLTTTELEAEYTLQFYKDIPAVRSYVTLYGCDSKGICLEYVSSFALSGITKECQQPQAQCFVSYAHNSWCNELQWRRESIERLGISPVSDASTLHKAEQYQDFSLNSVSIFGQGTWSSSEYLPMGALETPAYSMVWQLEANCPWQWEISTIAGHYYLQLSGPDDNRHHWHVQLKKGEKFTSVPVAIAFSESNREAAFVHLIQYRRRLCRPSRDHIDLPIIFNEYMVLLGNPTQAKLLPLIDAAAEAGCEYFCIDSGWYADDNWWDSVGAWLPQPQRFPDTLPFIMKYIRQKGMIPGLWLELEVMGIHCPLAYKLPDECFFMRNGIRIIDHSRYQLDFRNPSVIRHANEVVDRLVRVYDTGYIKMDYNINGGYGTEVNCDSAGDGLLKHSRAYLEWLDDVFRRYPKLIIENCASGGMRMDYALLSRLSIQSLTDQDEAVRLSRIAVAAPSAVNPEQAACWSLPRLDASDEEIILCMVNTMLLRIHQSGDLGHLSDTGKSLVHEAFEAYRSYRSKIPTALPFWPIGLPDPDSGILSLGLCLSEDILIAVWQLAETGQILLPLPHPVNTVSQLYPKTMPCYYELSSNHEFLSVSLPCAPCARLFQLK